VTTILDKLQLHDPVIAGNKAAMLAKLKDAGFRVPPFFVIEPKALQRPAADIGSVIDRAVQSICGIGSRLAVRSSSSEEDDAERSFAGQFDSFLDIRREEVVEYAVRVTNSGHSEHVRAYRASTGQRQRGTAPAVIVQQMIAAEAAGVAFAADPVSGDTSCAVVAATRGNGQALVSGEVQGDAWRVDQTDAITERTLAGPRASLSDREIRRVARLVRRVSEWRGRAQDIEWAIADGRLYLLQSRDITTIPAAGSGPVVAVWDNSNIVESYGGVTLPLTYSVARLAYQEAYRHLGRVIGISQRDIDGNARAYEQMIGLIQGRVYYNLLNWYRLLMLTPGFRYNKRFMEQMMGVTEGLPKDAIPARQDDRRFARFLAAAGLSRVAWRLALRLIGHHRNVESFHRGLDDFLGPVDLDAKSLDELLECYETLQAKVIPLWDTPLVNDIFCMTAHGALRALCGRWLGEEHAGIHNELVAGEAAIISLEPVTRMRSLAALAAGDPEFVTALCGAPVAAVEHVMRRHPQFCAAYESYLDRFGDRCLDELKLESPTLRDDPLPLLRAVGNMAAASSVKIPNGDRRTQATAQVAKALSRNPLRRLVFAATLALARARVRDRENLRFERTRVYGRVRAVFVAIGRKLQELGAIDDAADVFYLDVAEIRGYIRGTGSTADLGALIAVRRREFAGYANNEDPPRRFVTRGPAQHPHSMQPVEVTVGPETNARRGQACSRGVVRGPVRIVRDPRNSSLVKGEILVAERTDPGWVTLFPLVSGMIMERGSLLSHSAIVARELDIPAVVGVDGAAQWLKDGDWVELDGAAGTIRKLDAALSAA